MPTNKELQAQNAKLEADLKEAHKGGDTASLKARIAKLEGAAGVDATPPRPSRQDEVRVKNYGGALLKTALEMHPDPDNYPEGGKTPSPLEMENIELRKQLAEQGARERAAADQCKPPAETGSEGSGSEQPTDPMVLIGDEVGE